MSIKKKQCRVELIFSDKHCRGYRAGVGREQDQIDRSTLFSRTQANFFRNHLALLYSCCSFSFAFCFQQFCFSFLLFQKSLNKYKMNTSAFFVVRPLDRILGLTTYNDNRHRSAADFGIVITLETVWKSCWRLAGLVFCQQL